MGAEDAPSADSETCPTADGMPMLGLGTWQNTDPETCAESVRTALEMGYRHVDTAQIYENEAAVGDGIAAADVDREDVFLATKLWITNLTSDDVLETARESLDRLGVEYVDLLYVHWPARTYDPEETFDALTHLYEEGLIERIGVSNFGPDDLETAVEVCDAPIAANQVELHPFLQQESIREVCERHGVEVVAYSPLARGEVFEEPTIFEIAEKYGISEAQVSLAWLRQQGVTAIPKATGEAHIRDNWESLALDLEPADVEAIDSIETTKRLIDPRFAPWN